MEQNRYAGAGRRTAVVKKVRSTMSGYVISPFPGSKQKGIAVSCLSRVFPFSEYAGIVGCSGCGGLMALFGYLYDVFFAERQVVSTSGRHDEIYQVRSYRGRGSR